MEFTSNAMLWLFAFIGLIVFEAITVQFVSIWFACGAFVSMFVALFGQPLNIQLIVFFSVSIILLILTRPIIKKYSASKKENLYVDSNIGQKGLVLEDINNIKGVGRVKANGLYWSARSEDDSIIKRGEEIEIIALDGVYAIVSKLKV